MTLIYFFSGINFSLLWSNYKREKEMGEYYLFSPVILSSEIKLCDEVSTKFYEMRNPVENVYGEGLLFLCEFYRD